jgi:hypothetical protein
MSKVKDWDDFQHYKTGKNATKRPEWIKLYTRLLDDIEFHNLDGKDAKTLILLWMLASENGGVLPEVKTIAFRLRLSEREINSILGRLPHWIEDIPRTVPRTEEEENTSKNTNKKEIENGATAPRAKARDDEFEEFWKVYPRKKEKRKALNTYLSALQRSTHAEILAGAQRYAAESRGKDPHYVKHASRWLTGDCWADEPDKSNGTVVAFRGVESWAARRDDLTRKHGKDAFKRYCEETEGK